MKDLGHWRTTAEPSKSDTPYGFIYVIENINTGKKYVGKKQILTARKTRKAGRKNRVSKVVETDWKTYTGSCRELNGEIEQNGKDVFDFNIIKWCDSKWEMSYYEAKEQFERDVIFRSDYYNGILNLRIPKAPKHLQEKYNNEQI